jgi:hypothetical protein
MRLLDLRLHRRPAIQRALLDAVFGVSDVFALDVRGRRRLQALLEGRSDEELERMARRGSAGQAKLRVELDLLFDGVPTAPEQEAMLRRLMDLLRRGDWPAPTLVLRSAVVADVHAQAEDATGG